MKIESIIKQLKEIKVLEPALTNQEVLKILEIKALFGIRERLR